MLNFDELLIDLLVAGVIVLLAIVGLVLGVFMLLRFGVMWVN